VYAFTFFASDGCEINANYLNSFNSVQQRWGHCTCV